MPEIGIDGIGRRGRDEASGAAGNHGIPVFLWHSRPSLGDDMHEAIRVLERPTRADIAREIKQGSGVLRAVRVASSGDIYVWDAEHGLHEEVIRHLGLGDMVENLGQIHSPDDLSRLTGR